MESALALIGTLVGAAIAFAGQSQFYRRQRRQRVGEIFLEQSATILALNEDFENRLWEERELGLRNRVAEWDLPSSRMAKAQLQILSESEEFDIAVARLHSTGVDLGRHWRKKQPGRRRWKRQDNDVELDRLLKEHQDAQEAFLQASADISRSILIKRRRNIRKGLRRTTRRIDPQQLFLESSRLAPEARPSYTLPRGPRSTRT